MQNTIQVAPIVSRARWRRVIIRLVQGVVVAFLLFEIIVRLLPADGAQLTIDRVTNSYPGHDHVALRYVEPQDARDIAKLDTMYNNLGVTIPAFFNSHPRCPEDITDVRMHSTLVLYWRGWPVQVWTSTNCSAWTRSSGGIPDPWGRD